MLKKLLPLFILFILACSGTKTQIKSPCAQCQIISAAWSDSRHLAYLAQSYEKIELHIAELAHNSPKIIKDSLITNDINKAYTPIGYCHTLQEVYFPDKNSIYKYDIRNKRMEEFSMYLPITTPIEDIFAQPGSTMVYAVRSDYREDYFDRFFYWIIWMNLVNGEIIYDTHNCLSSYGYFLEEHKGLLHYVDIDTVGARNDTITYSIDKHTRRLKENDLTPDDVQIYHRNEWQSPNLEYMAVQGKGQIEIHSVY